MTTPNDRRLPRLELAARGDVVAWGEPVPVKRTELLRWNVARGRESVIAVRSDPTLRSTLQIGSWFASRWRVRAIRRLVLALPGALPFAVAHLWLVPAVARRRAPGARHRILDRRAVSIDARRMG
jgi:hypothetical protein